MSTLTKLNPTKTSQQNNTRKLKKICDTPTTMTESDGLACSPMGTTSLASHSRLRAMQCNNQRARRVRLICVPWCTSGKCFSGDVRHQTAILSILANWLLLYCFMSSNNSSSNKNKRFSSPVGS